MFGIGSSVNPVVQCFKTVLSKRHSSRGQRMLHTKFSTAKSRLEKLNEIMTKEFLYYRIDQNPLCENYCREPQRGNTECRIYLNTQNFSQQSGPQNTF